MKRLFIRLYALVVVVLITGIIGIFTFNIIGDMNKEVENAEIAFKNLEKAILNEVKASQLEDMVAKQKLRRIANTLAIKGFVVQLAPSKGAVFSYPPDSSLFVIVNGNVLIREDSKFLKVFRTENYVNIGEENKVVHLTMIRSILPAQMIFLRSRTAFFLMIFIVLVTISIFIYLNLQEREKVERVYTDFLSPSDMKRNNPVLRTARQSYGFNDDIEEHNLKNEGVHYEDVNRNVYGGTVHNESFEQTNAHFPHSKNNSFSNTVVNEPAQNPFQNTPYMNPTNTSYDSSQDHGHYVSSNPSSFNTSAFVEKTPSSMDLLRREQNVPDSMQKGYQAEPQLNYNKRESELTGHENKPHPYGLFSPSTGLVWKVYVPERLNSEIGKAAEIDQDISFILIKILDVDYSSLDQKRLAEIMLEVFKFKDMIFEYSDNETLGFAAILQDAYVDEAVRVCNRLFSKLQHEIFLTGQEPRIKMGITTRACRFLSASTMINEAEQALYNAMQNESEAIIGYQPNTEKYRQNSIENDR